MRKLLFLLPLLLSPLDTKLSAYFFHNGSFSKHPFFTAFYTFGEYPAFLFVGLSSALFSLSFLLKPLRKYRITLLYLALNLVLGGFLINEKIFKEHFGRPRPKQTTLFGGTEPFRPLYRPNLSLKKTDTKSFACGHATAGFYFFCIAKLFRGRKKNLWNTFALLFGALLGLSRIAQGGHFLSDVAASGLIMWGSANFLHYILFKRHENTHPKTT